MTNQQDTALLPVEQDDREAAAELHIADCGEPLSPYDRRIEQDYRSGKNDDWNDVQAFARHRIAAEQAKPSASCEAGEVERVREVLGRLFNICDRNPHAQSVIRAALASGAGDEG